ncbi:MAG TPA: AAA family ATPase [Pseudobdellovibrionaceae bacterium]|jgi:hypothetical protein
MERYLSSHLRLLLKKKLILLMGPRQVGKTTLSKSLVKEAAYYNYDIKKDLQVFMRQEWDRSKELVIFDELHKMKKWKLWLKGLYDEGFLEKQKVLVTGSARLDIAKKMGDSLAGRFFSLRLNPLDLKELKGRNSAEKNYRKLLLCGGFPEPFFEGSEKFYGLWKRTHTDLILRQDMITLENIRDLDGVETLVELLTQRVGSTISIHSLAEDLDRDDKTIKHWLQVLENLYIVFRVPPKAKNIARGIKKSSKYYFFDIARVENGEAAQLENLVALSLKKELEFLEDTEGLGFSLSFAKTKDDKEIDFVIERPKKKPLLIEVKLSDANPAKNFDLFRRFFPQAECIQLVRQLDREFSTPSGTKVMSALPYLENLNLL